MSRTHKRVRLHRGGLTGEWSAVRVNQMGVITDRWPIHPDDQAVLNDRWQTAAAERDALAARLAAVEALADEWDKSDDTHEWILAADLRAALTGKENDQ